MGIVTPEAVVLDFETAGVGTRTVATLIDLAVQIGALLAFIIGFGLLAGTSLGLAGVLIGIFVAILGYPILMETLWAGRTLGKAALGLRVVTVEGGQIGLRHALIRGAFDLVDLLITGGAAATLTVLTTPRNQRLGDLAAGTLVLRERTGATRAVGVRFVAPPGWAPYAASLDVSRLSGEDYQAVRSFLLRAGGLHRSSRTRVAERIATALLPRLQHTPPPGVAAEPFLVCVAARYQEVFQRAVPGGGSVPGDAAYVTGLPPDPAARLTAEDHRRPGEPPQQGGATTTQPGDESAPTAEPPGGFVAPA